MKFLQVAILLVAVLCVRAHNEKVAEYAKECQTETSASDEEVQSLIEHHAPTTEVGKCLRACVMKKFGIMTEAGTLDKDATITVLKEMAAGDEEKEKHAVNIVEACVDKEVTADNACENAATYLTCFKEESIKHGENVEME